MKHKRNLSTRTVFSIYSFLLTLTLISQGILPVLAQKTYSVKNSRLKTEQIKEPVENTLLETSIIPADFGFFNAAQTQTATRIAPQVGTHQGSETEPNNTTATADALSGTEGKITGSLLQDAPLATAGADTDFYTFTTTVPNSKLYAATMNASSQAQDTILAVIASDGTTVLETDNNDGSLGGNASSIAGTTLPAAGTYYLRVTNNVASAAVTPYDLYFAVRSSATTAETEPNNNGTPQAIPASQYVNGVINPAGDTDTFSFALNAGDTVFLSLDLDPERDGATFNGRLAFGLFGTPPNFLLVNDTGAGDTIDSEAHFMTVETTGTYTVYVDDSAGVGSATSTYALNVGVIPALAAGTCTTYTNNTATPLADLALTSSPIAIPDSKIIRSLRVTTDITHANFPDLDVQLRSPAANDNGLFTDIGLSTQTGAQNINLSDEAAVPIVFNVLNGSIFRPEPSYRLNWFNGENALGTWTLDIRDDATANTGTLNSWSLEVCEEAATPAGNLIYSEDFGAGNGGFTSSGTQNEWEYGTPATPLSTGLASFTNCATGTSCWKTDLDNTYNASSSQDLTSPVLNLTAYQGTIKLYWQQRYQMESTQFDHIWVEATEVGNPANSRIVWHADNQTMTNVVGNTSLSIGESAGWGRYNADLSDFAGKIIQLTFHLDSDTTVQQGGWAIDDVQLYNVSPTAASVGVSGRVVDPKGNAISRAIVTLTGSDGVVRSVKTNTFGYYRFDTVEVGDTYILNAERKGYLFSPRVLSVQDEIADADLEAIE